MNSSSSCGQQSSMSFEDNSFHQFSQLAIHPVGSLIISSPPSVSISLSNEHCAGGDASRAQPVDGARPVSVARAHDRLDGIGRRKREGDGSLGHFALPSLAASAHSSQVQSLESLSYTQPPRLKSNPSLSESAISLPHFEHVQHQKLVISFLLRPLPPTPA